MPTEPVKEFLDRERVRDISKPVIEIASPLLKEVVNYATNVLDKCQSSKKADKEEAFPLLALYAHIIQMADSAEVLISNGCGPPGYLLLRSSYEARLSIRYLLEKDTDKRSIAWLIKYYDDEIAYLEIMDPTNPKGKEYREKHKDDDIYKIAGPPSLPGINEQIAKLRAKIEQPGFAEVYTEYKRRKTRTRQYPEWYSLFGGPLSLKKLAEHFKEGAIYESLYRLWSKTSHANEATHAFFIRNPIQIVEVASTTVSHLLETTNLMLNHFQSNRVAHFEKWLAREVMPRQSRLIDISFAHLAFLGKELNPRKQGT
jgi:hypothetical protein